MKNKLSFNSRHCELRRSEAISFLRLLRSCFGFASQSLAMTIAVMISACFLIPECVSAQESPGARPVRIRIFESCRAASVRVNGPYEIQCAAGGEVIVAGKNLKTQISVSQDVFLLGKKKYPCSKIFLKAKESESTILNGRKFTGGILFIKKDAGHFAVINYTDLEDYIKGVLYHEVSHYWPIEVLKAQAIVCRSFTLCQMRENAGKDFDVTNDIYSQVYGGKTSERYRTNMAVDATKGQVLMYKGSVLPAYYHSTCGGYTENASTLWNINIPALSGVPCDFCRDTIHSSWHTVMPLSDIKAKLRNAGFAVDEIKDIVLKDRNRSGRITRMIIVTGGKEVPISAKDFRNILNPNSIRSTNFTLRITGDSVEFTGTGWGHGVGMCQWGAYFMGKQGYTFEQILNYYYPGSSVQGYNANY